MRSSIAIHHSPSDIGCRMSDGKYSLLTSTIPFVFVVMMKVVKRAMSSAPIVVISLLAVSLQLLPAQASSTRLTSRLSRRAFVRFSRSTSGPAGASNVENSIIHEQQSLPSFASRRFSSRSQSHPDDHCYKDDHDVITSMKNAVRLRRPRSPLFKTQKLDSQSSENDIAKDGNRELKIQLPALTEPLIDEETWNSLTGSEFVENPSLVDDLAIMGERVARSNDDDSSSEKNGMSITWKREGKKKQSSAQSDYNLSDGDIVAWTGHQYDTSADNRKKTYRGSHLPFVKTQAIIEGASPKFLADLLMDSTRVQTYNPWSVGRRDLWTLLRKRGEAGSDNGTTLTKIVRNKTQPPFKGKALVATTLLHCKPLEQGGYLVVSRAVGGDCWNRNSHSDGDNDPTSLSKKDGVSDILLGVNLLELYHDGDSGKAVATKLTAVTHVYSRAIPTMLALRLGVKSAKQFVKDLRKAGAAASGESVESRVAVAAE